MTGINDNMDCPDRRGLLAADRTPIVHATAPEPGTQPDVGGKPLISTTIIAMSVGDGEADLALVEPMEKDVVLTTIVMANDHHHWFKSVDDVDLQGPLTELGCFNLTITVNGGTSTQILFWVVPPEKKG